MKRSMFRVLATVMSLLILATCLPLTVFAAYENTHLNTGDQAADIVAVAATQVGYLEGSYAGTTAGSNNVQKYGLWYDNNVDNIGVKAAAWCAAFVSWCANQAGIPSSTVYYHAYCPFGVNWFKNQGRWQASASRGGNYIPQPGDIIYFQSSTEASHVGIVRYSDGTYVYTIEGNTSGQNGEVNEGGGVFAKKYALSYANLLGYGTPNYETGTGTTAAKLGTYKITASSLNVRAGAGTSYDIVGELANGALVVVTELSGTWGKVTLDNGVTGWCSVGDYGDYIGVDVLDTDFSAAWGGEYLSYTTNSDGSVTFTNTNNSEAIAVDLPLVNAIGNRTTPYLNMSVSRHSGGWYFGLTKSGSGYFMMRECTSGDELVVASTATYMQTDEQLQIDVGYWWAPEDKAQIDTVRLYLNALSSVTMNYCYFADSPNVVTNTSYNMRKGGSVEIVVPDPINLLVPSTLNIPDRTKTGGYSYQNGVLTVTSGDANGYDVAMDVNLSYKPEELSRWLISVESDVRFDIELLVTTSDGDRTFSLCDDFYYEFTDSLDNGYLPAFTGSAGLGILGCYTWNNVLPADGVSTVKAVTFRLGGIGTLVVNSCQLAANDALTMFTDTVSKSDSTPDEVIDPAEPIKGDVNNDGEVSTMDARALLKILLGSSSGESVSTQVGDFDGNGEVSTSDVRTMLKLLLA